LKYALFLGCTISVREQNYEIAVREVAKKLEIEFEDIEDFSCCGFPIKSTNTEVSLIIAARNLSIAANKGIKICALCNACTAALTEANKELTYNLELRKKINKELAKIGRKFTPGVEIKHFSRVLFEDVGIDAIKKKVVRDLRGLKFSVHYGCHYLRPSSLYDHFEDAENPYTVEKLVAATGAEVVNYKNKLDCCGGPIFGIEKNIARSMAKHKLDIVTQAKVDALITICPLCSIIYEDTQKKMETEFNLKYNLPVVYLPQILGLAFGIDIKQLGFHLNKIKPDALLEKVNAIK
jgi:heterodisulfide reductase subunit B